MNYNLYYKIPQLKKDQKKQIFFLNYKKVEIIIKIFFKKCQILFAFIILSIITNNINLEYLADDLFFACKKKYHSFLKYFKSSSFNIINISYLNKISLINEIIYLNNIRKEMNFYKNINISNINLKKFFKVIHPKISLIITVYNQENYLLRIYSCILKQSLKEIEIIFVDDKSSDNSTLIIQKLMKLDKRITLIRNKINRGQFYSRNRAVLISKSKFVIILDPDDFLLNNILIKSYKIAQKLDLDILQFYHIMGNLTKNHLYILNQNSQVIHQPKTNNIFFNIPTRYLWDKLIKKETFVKSIYFMHEKYRKERFVIHNDDTACFGLFKTADSYGQLEEVGYFYNRNIPNSTTKQNFFQKNLNGRFHCIFSIMKYYYEQTENNAYEKIKGGYNFFTYRIIRKYGDKIQFLTDEFNFINDVINIYLKCPFFNLTQKGLLEKFKAKINEQKSKIHNKIF